MKSKSFYRSCAICNNSPNIKNGGKSYINQHILTQKPKRCMTSSTSTKKRDKITDIRLTETEMKKINNHSSSCNGPLFSHHRSLSSNEDRNIQQPEEFSDFKIESKFSSGWMKSPAVTSSVIAPFPVTGIIEVLLPFSTTACWWRCVLFLW